MTQRAILIALLAVSLAGCDLFGGEDEPTSLDGSWAGTVTTQGTEYRISMDLQQNENAQTIFGGDPVAGSGQVRGDGQTYSFSVSGTYAQQSVSMNLQYTDGRPGNLVDGTVPEDFSTIRGTLVGGPVAFDDVSVTLRRE